LLANSHLFSTHNYSGLNFASTPSRKKSTMKQTWDARNLRFERRNVAAAKAATLANNAACEAANTTRAAETRRAAGAAEARALEARSDAAVTKGAVISCEFTLCIHTIYEFI
jgi:hypothetical protein